MIVVRVFKANVPSPSGLTVCFQIPSEAHWREVRQVAKNVGNARQSAMRTIETANPDKLYGIFGDAQWTNKDRLSDTMLRALVEHFGSYVTYIRNVMGWVER